MLPFIVLTKGGKQLIHVHTMYNDPQESFGIRWNIFSDLMWSMGVFLPYSGIVKIIGFFAIKVMSLHSDASLVN